MMFGTTIALVSAWCAVWLARHVALWVLA